MMQSNILQLNQIQHDHHVHPYNSYFHNIPKQTICDPDIHVRIATKLNPNYNNNKIFLPLASIANDVDSGSESDSDPDEDLISRLNHIPPPKPYIQPRDPKRSNDTYLASESFGVTKRRRSKRLQEKAEKENKVTYRPV